MKAQPLNQIFFFILVLTLIAGTSYASPEKPSSVDVSTVYTVVRFHAGMDSSEKNQWLIRKQILSVKVLPQIDTWIFELSADTVDQWMQDFYSDPNVVWAQEEGWVYASGITPDDPYYQPQQENLRLIGLPSAWEFNRGDANPIAIVDTGIDLTHSDLHAKIWANEDELPENGFDDDGNGFVDDVVGWNFVSNNALPQDDNGHGSHVAGIAAAHTNNSVGIAGVAWHNPIMPLKALNNNGAGQASHVAAAILYAVDQGARIINLSLGSIEEQLVIRDAVIYALEKDCLVIAAAGNTASAVEFPAAQPGVLAVSATTNQDLPATFTNRGPEVDIAAPGVNIFSANQRGGYYISSGTSQSTPHVSGLAALIWSLQPEWSALQVSQVITSTAKDVWSPGKDNLTGWGRIDTQKAVFKALKQYYIPLIILDRLDDAIK
jgi:subtilisin family serine protease